MHRDSEIRIRFKTNCIQIYKRLPPSLPASSELCCLYIQFGPRSGPTKCHSRLGSKLADTLIVYLKEIFGKRLLEKSKQTTTKA